MVSHTDYRVGMGGVAFYNPAGSGFGNCVSCHMPPTTRSGRWTRDCEGALMHGDLHDHTFVLVPPTESAATAATVLRTTSPTPASPATTSTGIGSHLSPPAIHRPARPCRSPALLLGGVELWACQTGVDLPTHPHGVFADEFFGLDGILLQYGVRSGIGSLVEVPDLLKALVVERFALARRIEGVAPPAALVRALDRVAGVLGEWKREAASFRSVGESLRWLDEARRASLRVAGLDPAALVPFTDRLEGDARRARALVEETCDPVHRSAFRCWGGP